MTASVRPVEVTPAYMNTELIERPQGFLRNYGLMQINEPFISECIAGDRIRMDISSVSSGALKVVTIKPIKDAHGPYYWLPMAPRDDAMGLLNLNLLPDNAIILTHSFTGCTLWIDDNRTALRHVNADTPLPDNGQHIEPDEGSGAIVVIVKRLNSLKVFGQIYDDNLSDNTYQVRKYFEPQDMPYSDDESEGSRKAGKSNCCYITTAVCKTLGLDDNCEELKVLRLFRNRMSEEDEIKKSEINRYYETAPRIVNEINRFKNSQEIYANLYYQSILPAINSINQNNDSVAYAIYKNLVNYLEKTYIG